jgi:putative two-component system response regulator
MALADVYDALISRRVYKEGMPHQQARQIIITGAGQHFDPVVVAAFQAVEQQFIQIAERFADSDAELQRKAAHLAEIRGQG